MTELMGCMDNYIAKKVIIQPELIPFTFDYIPAVGEVDPMIKVPRPDQASFFLQFLV